MFNVIFHSIELIRPSYKLLNGYFIIVHTVSFVIIEQSVSIVIRIDDQSCQTLLHLVRIILAFHFKTI